MGTDSPQEPPEGAQPCQCLAFGRRNPFWTSEQLVFICYSSNRRLTQQPWKEEMVTGPTVQTQRSVITGPRGWVAGDGTWAQCPRAGALFALSADPLARPGQCWGCPWSVFCWLAGVPPPFTSHPTYLYGAGTMWQAGILCRLQLCSCARLCVGALEPDNHGLPVTSSCYSPDPVLRALSA